MQILDAAGAKLDAKYFIQIYHRVKKIAPARFLSFRMHPDVYKVLYALADIPESIQMGPTLGPLGKEIWRIISIKPPLGVNDGLAIVQDPEVDPHKLVFEIHGIPELVVENITYDTPPQSPECAG